MPVVNLSEIHFRSHQFDPEEEEEEVEPPFGFDDYVVVSGSIFLNGIYFRAFEEEQEEEEEE